MHRIFNITFVKSMLWGIGRYYWLKLLIKTLKESITSAVFWVGVWAVIIAIAAYILGTENNIAINVDTIAILALVIFSMFFIRNFILAMKKRGKDDEVIVFESKNTRDRLKRLERRISRFEIEAGLFERHYTGVDQEKYRSRLEEEWNNKSEREKTDIRKDNRQIALEIEQRRQRNRDYYCQS